MPHRQAIFTLCTANHLGQAAALAHSLAEHEGNTRRIVVLAEREVPEAMRAKLRGLLRSDVCGAAIRVRKRGDQDEKRQHGAGGRA